MTTLRVTFNPTEPLNGHMWTRNKIKSCPRFIIRADDLLSVAMIYNACPRFTIYNPWPRFIIRFHDV